MCENADASATITLSQYSILTWREAHCDQQYSGLRVRLIHCTWDELTPATTSNRRGSGVKFLIVGLSVRADPV